MYLAAEAAHPITGRGIGYKLFTMSAIPSMGRADMQRLLNSVAGFASDTNPDHKFPDDTELNGKAHRFVYVICRCRVIGNGDHSCFGARRGAMASTRKQQFHNLGK